MYTTDLQRTVGFWGGIAVMIGVIIGSGIFRTAPNIAAHIGSPLVILGLWVAGGLLCLAGALTYAELAAMYPASGGVYVFIREGYGNCAAFVFGWAYLVLIKPLGAGGIAFVFGESLSTLLGITEHKDTWSKVVTTIMLVVLTAVNLRGVGMSTALSGVLTALKFGTLAAIVLLTILLGKADLNALRPVVGNEGGLFEGIVPALALILWTYDGWADVGSIAGEVKNPQRTLPRIYIGGLLSIIAIYLLVNAAYFMIVPLPEMRAAAQAQHAADIWPEIVRRLVGNAGWAIALAVLVASTLGSTHASILTGARVSYAQARDGLLFRFIGHCHPRWATPDVSLAAQSVLSIAAVWLLGSFQDLANGFVFTMWIFYAMAGSAIFVLRVRRPDAHRPFRCPGYPVVPALFILAAAAMTAMGIYDDRHIAGIEMMPWLGKHRFLHTLPWLVALSAGIPVYYIWRRYFPAAPER